MQSSRPLLISGFPSSGVTALARSMASTSGSVLLDEVYYVSHYLGEFTPMGWMPMALRQGVEISHSYLKKRFREDLIEIQKSSSMLSRRLIVREHTFSRFIGDERRAPIEEACGPHFFETRVIVVRSPRLAYFSSVRKGHFKQDDLSYLEFLDRYTFFIEHHPEALIVRLEDVLSNPNEAGAHLGEKLFGAPLNLQSQVRSDLDLPFAGMRGNSIDMDLAPGESDEEEALKVFDEATVHTEGQLNLLLGYPGPEY